MKKNQRRNNQGTEDTDPRLELVKSLIEYKKYKYASKELQNYEEVQKKGIL